MGKVVGISGASCSGKTTLASNLGKTYQNKAICLSIDEYFLWNRVSDQTKDWEDPGLYDFNKIYSDVTKWKKGEKFFVKANSRESRQKSIKEIWIVQKDFLIFEGFLALYNDRVNRLFDIKLFIDIPKDVMVKRRLARNREKSPWEEEDYINSYFISGFDNYVHPQKTKADFVLDGTSWQEDLLTKAIKIIGF